MQTFICNRYNLSELQMVLNYGTRKQTKYPNLKKEIKWRTNKVKLNFFWDTVWASYQRHERNDNQCLLFLSCPRGHGKAQPTQPALPAQPTPHTSTQWTSRGSNSSSSFLDLFLSRSDWFLRWWLALLLSLNLDDSMSLKDRPPK